MDLFACDSAMNLRLVETKKVNVNWYIYTHESRLVLLASGLQCKTITGFQVLHKIYHQRNLNKFIRYCPTHVYKPQEEKTNNYIGPYDVYAMRLYD